MNIYKKEDRVEINRQEWLELKKDKTLVNKVDYVAIPQTIGFSRYNGYKYYKLNKGAL